MRRMGRERKWMDVFSAAAAGSGAASGRPVLRPLFD
jgi:hypothetical protein